MKKTFFLIIFIIIMTFSFSESFYPTTINSLTANVKLFGSGEINGLKEGQEITFQTLTFQESRFQKIDVIKEELYINENTIYPEYVFDAFDNKHVLFTIKENGKFNYVLEAKASIQSIINELTDYNISTNPEKLSVFLEKSEKIESDSSEILTITSNKLFNNSFIENLNQTIFWVNDYVEYAKGSEFQKYYLLQKSAIDTLLSKKGVCDEFSNLAASVLRAKKIPTRLAIGITFDGKEWGNHAWLEVHHKDLGWIPSDPTFREAGFVDGTHIKMGSFNDVTLSIAKATFPSNAEIIFNNQTLPQVEILNKEFFNFVDVKIKNNELKTKQWNEIKLNITNKTNGKLTIPIKIQENYERLFIDKKTKSIILDENETGEISFFIYPNVEIEKNQIAKGTLIFNSLNEPIQKEFKITYSEEKNNGFVKVIDVSPIVLSDKIRFEIKIKNNSINKNKINISIDENKYYWIEELDEFEEQTIQKTIPLDEKGHLLKIKTPTEEYTQKIIPAIIEIKIVNKPKETITITQEITKDKNKNNKNFIFQPEIIIFILLPLFAVALLILFATKKRYV